MLGPCYELHENEPKIENKQMILEENLTSLVLA